ncbi:MAG TPA: putative O-glycosylation ligase, exosortase A system-associated [Casimicrobiaceae bacterium]|nr:putative O-glycosylation ligase, exosortase A system-associated [Casimicrobiaceae bacterium]
MRDVLVLGLVFGLSAYAVMHPYVGVLAWTWVSVMNPHRLAWGFAVNFPVALTVVIGTMAGILLTRDRRRMPPRYAPVVVLALFVAWMCFTSAMAIYPEQIGELFSRVMKIMFMVFVAMCLLNSRKHVELLVWVLVISLGFYGLKGGLFTLVGGGEFRVWGPAGSFIEGNNEIALALIMAIPLMRYLQMVSSNRWVRIGLGVTMVFTALAALGSQSRGALLAIGAMSGLLWLRSEHKLVSGIVIATLAVSLVAFMPSTWEARMQTIDTENLDSSALGRLNAWKMAWNLAKDRPIGGGFEVTTPEMFMRYAPNPKDIHAAHSIYFEVLGEHGFPGVMLFLLLWWLVWRDAGRLRRLGARSPPVAWAGKLGSMIQVSLTGYLVGGAFLSLAYFDLPYDLLVLVVITRMVVEEAQQAATATAGPAQASAPVDVAAAPPPKDRSFA